MLLQLAKRIFEEQTSLDKVVHNIMLESRELLHCERCSVSLVDTSMIDVRVRKCRNVISTHAVDSSQQLYVGKMLPV